MDDRLRRIGRLSASIAAIGVITALYFKLLRVNPTTVALTYVVAVLVLATRWGIAEATTASLLAVACFNFFFLPPVATWTIADPQNWVALGVLMITAIVASQLSDRARRRTLDALARQRDLERLYALSRALLLSEPDIEFPRAIAKHIANTFEVPTVAVYDAHADDAFWGGTHELRHIDDRLREVARQSVSLRDVEGMIVTAVRLGSAPIGSLALTDVGLSDTVLQSIANLAAIGLERARADRAAARAEAARQSGELRATVMDALAHEFKTPLTATKAACSDLVASGQLGLRERELAAIVGEGIDQLQQLVSDAVQMLRIDAGTFAVHRQRKALAGVVRDTLESVSPRLDGHEVVNRVPERLLVDADPDLLTLALRQLLDNAVKYSPPTSTIEVSATSNGTVDIAIRNSGPPIPPHEQVHIFDRFFRGTQARHVAGSGLGLAIVQQIARAHDGSVSVTSDAMNGTEFRVSLPREELS